MTLMGSGTGPEGEALTYTWSQLAGGPRVALLPVSGQPAQRSFTTPTMVSGETQLMFRLTVTVGAVSASDDVGVRVTDDNLRPIADAGVDQTVMEGEIVILDATGSSDPEGEALRF